MNIDLNNEYTTDDVSCLIASKDDSQHRQLRVTKEGIAFISDEVGNMNVEGLAFRLPTWVAGNSYTGNDASRDANHVKSIEKTLRDNWPNPKGTYIDFI